MNLITKRCKLFPITSPNFTMLNTVESLEGLLGEVVITTVDLSKFLSPTGEYEPIGYVAKNNNYTVEDGFICGDCLFWNDGDYEWANASAKTDYEEHENNEAYVTFIDAIEMREINESTR